VSAGSLVVRAEHRLFGGRQGFYEHTSEACAGPMRFGLFLPPRALAGERVPALYFLAGLTCTEETFAIKAGAQRVAAELGLALVTPDTSPRASRYPGDDEHWDFGLGAGFYLDATVAPWSASYRLRTWLTRELRTLCEGAFPLSTERRGVFGHSMGGHGALVLALTHPGEYQSVSAFAPIVAPSRVPWGEKAFSRYLGDDPAAWRAHDATSLLEAHASAHGAGAPPLPTVLVDQGLSDKFLERELRPELFEAACARAGQPLILRRHEGYDHSYWFIATFVEAHLRHHAETLLA
jgi:S-formylglutathione hydrolase